MDNSLLVFLACVAVLALVVFFPRVVATTIKLCRWFWFFVISSWGYDGPLINGWPQDTIVGVYAVIVCILLPVVILAGIAGAYRALRSVK